MSKNHRHLIALAACAFSLPTQIGSDRLIWLQLTPAGHFKPRDGRAMSVPSWHINAAIASGVLMRFKARKTPPVIDYEHQTLYKEENGQPAPAAGFIRDMVWREGEGLFAQVELTARAAEYITAGEYKYFSPVFLYSPKTGDVLDVQMGALTNNPAIDGMEELTLRAAATFGLTKTEEESTVNPLLKAILTALGLPESTTEQQAIAALTAATHKRAELRKQLGLDEAATDDAVLAACTGLKVKAANPTEPNPAKFVPVKVVEEMRGEIAALTASVKARDEKDLETLISDALEDGKLMKSMEEWARDLGKKDRAALTAYLDKVTPIAALTASQTGGKQPVADEKTGLTEGELAVCTAMGITPDAFKAAKSA